MTRIDIVRFNKELFQRLQSTGIKIEDWRYVELYDEYERLLQEDVKRTAVALILAAKYKLSERQVYNIIKHLKTPIK